MKGPECTQLLLLLGGINCTDVGIYFIFINSPILEKQ